MIRTYLRVTGSGQVCGTRGRLLGFYVASTTAGTLTLFDNTAASGTQVAGLITPAIGWHALTCDFLIGLFVTVGGTIDVTFIIGDG